MFVGQMWGLKNGHDIAPASVWRMGRRISKSLGLGWIFQPTVRNSRFVLVSPTGGEVAFVRGADGYHLAVYRLDGLTSQEQEDLESVLQANFRHIEPEPELSE